MQDLLKRLHGECAQAVVKDEKAAADAPNVMQVMMCLRSKLTVWKEEQFNVLPGQGIKQWEKRVVEWVVKVLPW